MKKIFLFISPLIAFFLGGLIFSFKINAQALPTPSADTFTLIEGGNSALSYSSFSTIDALPFNSDPTQLNRVIGVASNNPLLDGVNLNSIGIDDYEIRRLSPLEIKSIQDSQYNTFYDVNSHEVDIEDVYFMHYENAMFHGDLYIDSNGDILTTDINNTYNAFKLGLGGKILGVTDIANIYDLISDTLNNNNYNYPLVDNLEPYSVYINVGYYWNANTKMAGYIFIPSGFVNGITVYKANPQSLDIYTNDLNNVIVNQYYPSSNNRSFIAIDNFNQSYNGYTYQYRIHFTYEDQYLTRTLSPYNDFLNGTSRRGYVFDRQNYSSNVQILNSDQTVSFKKIIDLPSTKVIQINDDYDYNSIKELEQNLNNIEPNPNELFDSSESIDNLNYPIEYPYPYPNTVINPSNLPFPSNETNPMPNPQIAPSIGEDIGDLDPNELRSGIPIINNLLNRFPFSIPWDIYSILNGFSSERETPYIDTTVIIPGVNYEWHIDYDLSDFNGLAILFRTLFLIGFIIGLAYFSYDHFFGS